MEWVLWWGIALTCVLAGLILPWSRTDDGNREGHDRTPAEGDETPTPVRPSEIRYIGTEHWTPATPGQCHACGTDNDPCYTYCQECLTPL